MQHEHAEIRYSLRLTEKVREESDLKLAEIQGDEHAHELSDRRRDAGSVAHASEDVMRRRLDSETLDSLGHRRWAGLLTRVVTVRVMIALRRGGNARYVGCR